MATKKYVARWGFVLGHPMNQPLRVGDEIEVDGTYIKHEGRDIAMPSIRGAIQQGWLVLSSSEEGKKALAEGETAPLEEGPGFAHMSTRKPGTTKTMAEEDGIEVGTAAARRRKQGTKGVQTDADVTVGELKSPTQLGEFIVKG